MMKFYLIFLVAVGVLTPSHSNAFSQQADVSGLYTKNHTICIYDHTTQHNDCNVAVQNTAEIMRRSIDRYAVEIEMHFTNGHSCTFNGIATLNGDRLTATDPANQQAQCVIDLHFSGNTMNTVANRECSYYCGARGSLDNATFTRNSY